LNKAILYITICTLFISLKSSAQNKVFLSENISVEFPDKAREFSQLEGQIMIYAVINDSFSCLASVFKGDTTFNQDSVNLIEGVDANIYQYVKVQFGKELSTSKAILDGVKVTHFSYKNDSNDVSDESYHYGTMIYHKNYLIFIEYAVNVNLDQEYELQRREFLESLKIE
jgi:hypothetical protein